MRKVILGAVLLVAVAGMATAQSKGFVFPFKYWDEIGRNEWLQFSPAVKQAFIRGFLVGSQSWFLGIGASETQEAFDRLASTVEVSVEQIVTGIDQIYRYRSNEPLSMAIIRLAAQLRGRW